MTDLNKVFRESSFHVAHDESVILTTYQGVQVIRHQCTPDEDMDGFSNNKPRADLHRRDWIEEGETRTYVYGCIVPESWVFNDDDSRVTIWAIHTGDGSSHSHLIGLFIERDRFRAYIDSGNGKHWLFDRKIVKGVETVFTFKIHFHHEHGWIEAYRYDQKISEYNGLTYFDDDPNPPYSKVSLYFGNYAELIPPRVLYVTKAT